MGVIFILEIAAGVAGFVINEQVYAEMQTIMNGTLPMYSSNENMMAQTWDITQSAVRFRVPPHPRPNDGVARQKSLKLPITLARPGRLKLFFSQFSNFSYNIISNS